MIVGITGAKIKRFVDGYKVIYNEYTIFESKTKDVALVVALNKYECERLLTDVLKHV